MLPPNRTSRAVALMLGGVSLLVAPAASALPMTRTMPVTASRASELTASPSRRTAPTAARRSPDSGYAPDPRSHVGAANRAARVEPEVTGFENAIQRYPWREGALYQVYAAPGQVTDIALQEGERLVGPGPVAAGDTVRWMIGDTLSGTGAAARVHILVKPTRPDISTNLVVTTDRRTYMIELRARESLYMPAVAWAYPATPGQRQTVPAAPVIPAEAARNYRYGLQVQGDSPPWRPVSVFDDGRRVYVVFPAGIVQGEMPPIFVLGTDGEPQIVNSRVHQNVLIVDRLFGAAELRLGSGNRQQVVRIVRINPTQAAAARPASVTGDSPS